jgi:CheY-like chemotaxis protein
VADRFVLVVDDFGDGRELLAEYLQWRGFRVATAASGEEAIRAATARRPAAILMDLGMPGIDGWQATETIRGIPHLADVLIVAVTAHALKPETDRAIFAGCDAVVSKPVDLAAFADALNIALVEGASAFNAIPHTHVTVRGSTTRSTGKRRPRNVAVR